MEVQHVGGEDEQRLTELRFDAAVKVIKSLPANGPFQPSNDMMLKFYSFYKQATVGSCNIPRPSFWDAVGKAKWDAWNSLGDMSKQQAMAAYVDEMKLILEGMPMTEQVEELLMVLGPFYELVDEKRKITQISDLSMGMGSMLGTAASKSTVRSIVRNMEMNGTLETRPGRARQQEDAKVSEDEDEEDEDEEDDDEEEDDNEGVRREVHGDSPSKRRGGGRRPNGNMANGVAHLTNGAHSHAAAKGGASEHVLNGHHAAAVDPDASAPPNLASDSDSEVYCDSVDQFGQEESSELNRTMDDLDEEDGHVPPGLDDPQAGHADTQVPQGIKCGGEDGESGGGTCRRGRLSGGVPGGFAPGRRAGSRGSDGGVGGLAPLQPCGGGNGERWGGGGAAGGSLNEQIVAALARLQDDMQSVLERLHTLEALTASQARSMALTPSYGPTPAGTGRKRPSWWPFDISPGTLAVALLWPFVVQWLFHLASLRRRRRMN